MPWETAAGRHRPCRRAPRRECCAPRSPRSPCRSPARARTGRRREGRGPRRSLTRRMPVRRATPARGRRRHPGWSAAPRPRRGRGIDPALLAERRAGPGEGADRESVPAGDHLAVDRRGLEPRPFGERAEVVPTLVAHAVRSSTPSPARAESAAVATEHIDQEGSDAAHGALVSRVARDIEQLRVVGQHPLVVRHRPVALGRIPEEPAIRIAKSESAIAASARAVAADASGAPSRTSGCCRKRSVVATGNFGAPPKPPNCGSSRCAIACAAVPIATTSAGSKAWTPPRGRARRSRHPPIPPPAHDAASTPPAPPRARRGMRASRGAPCGGQ